MNTTNQRPLSETQQRITRANAILGKKVRLPGDVNGTYHTVTAKTRDGMVRLNDVAGWRDPLTLTILAGEVVTDAGGNPLVTR